MSSNITLSAGVRANLLSLQDTAQLMQTTQTRLATGKKVNSALDNPLNFFTSSSLSTRANSLSGLLDAMSNGIQTIQAANNGLTAITSLVHQLQSTVSQARSDATASAITPTSVSAAANTSTAANNQLTFDLGGGATIAITTFDHTNATVSTTTGSGGIFTNDLSAGVVTVDDGSGSGPQAITFQAGSVTLAAKIIDINTSLATAGSTVIAQDSGGELQFVNSTGKTITVVSDAASQTELGLAATQTSTDGAVAVNTPTSLADLVTAINGNSYLSGKVKASIVSGALQLDNLTTSAITLKGYNGTNVTGNSADTNTLGAGTGGGLSSVRQNLLNQFNGLLGQIDKLASDAGFNGINLLNGDTLKLNFNENGTSSVDVHTSDSTGAAFAITSANLGIIAGTTGQFADNTQLDTLSTNLATALTTLQTQSATIASSLSVVQTRQDFTKSMINTLQTGADNLVLADSNEEGANLLALQTRQSLSTTALSLSAQADRNVLRLFGG